MKNLLKTFCIPRYTKAFWVSYVFCILWAVAVTIAFFRFAPANENFQNMATVEAALSVKLSLRRILAVILGGIVISVLIFTNSKYLDKVLIVLAAWMWAAYIDDYLVMHPYVYVPKEFIAQFLMKLRPLIVVFVSWMAMEAHLRREAA